MSEDAERIRQQMQHVRQEMGEGMHDVVHGARQLSDWKYYVRKYPWACVGSAFALGFLVTPARRKLLASNPAELAKLVEQLRRHGLDAGALGAGLAGGAGSGLAARAFRMLWPILLRNGGKIVAQQLAARREASAEPATTKAHGGP